jgi:hypothetical protein
MHRGLLGFGKKKEVSHFCLGNWQNARLGAHTVTDLSQGLLSSFFLGID